MVADKGTAPLPPATAAESQPDKPTPGTAGVTFLPDASPTKPRSASEREAYFPGTEELGPNEMRVIAWGPSGEKPEFGTKYALENFKRALTWDIEGRKREHSRFGRRIGNSRV